MGHWGDRPTSGVSACTVSERGMVPLGNPRRHLRHAPSCPYDKARKLGYLSPNSLFAIFGRLLPDTIILQHFEIVLVLLNAQFALWHASSKNVTYNNYFLVKMLADFLPSSCFLHSGEIIRNDFILTAQMNTKWNLGYYYCR